MTAATNSYPEVTKWAMDRLMDAHRQEEYLQPGLFAYSTEGKALRLTYADTDEGLEAAVLTVANWVLGGNTVESITMISDKVLVNPKTNESSEYLVLVVFSTEKSPWRIVLPYEYQGDKVKMGVASQDWQITEDIDLESLDFDASKVMAVMFG